MNFDSRLSPFAFAKEEMNELGTEKNQLNELNCKRKAIKLFCNVLRRRQRMFMVTMDTGRQFEFHCLSGQFKQMVSVKLGKLRRDEIFRLFSKV